MKGTKTQTVNDSDKNTGGINNSLNQTGAVSDREKNGCACEQSLKSNPPPSANEEKMTSTVLSPSEPSCQPLPMFSADTTQTRHSTESGADPVAEANVKDMVASASDTSSPLSHSEDTARGTEVAVPMGGDSRDQEWSLLTSRAEHLEVAANMNDGTTPQLIRMRKFSSPNETGDPGKSSSDGPGGDSSRGGKVRGDPSQLEAPPIEVPRQRKRVEFSPQTKEASFSEDFSSTHGGKAQHTQPEKSSSAGTEPVRMRHKSGSRRAADRRVSCKDLGLGDCQGWLYKKKEKDRTLSRQWHKRWCVLKSFNLYYYKNKEDLRAEGVIYMPAFQVSPAYGQKSKKFAFKVHNSGTTFYFASERQDDMSKWMNKMGLAAISFDTSMVMTTGGFIRPEPRCQHLEVPCNMYYSESDEDQDESQPPPPPQSDTTSTPFLLTTDPSTSSTISSSPPVQRRGVAGVPGVRGQVSGSQGESGAQGPKVTAAGSVKEGGGDELHTVLRAIHSQDLTIDGVDRRKRRTSHLSSILGTADGRTDANVTKLRKLLALKRTLKVKEQELQDIDRLLASHPNAGRLRDFVYRHPDLKL